MNFYPHIPSWCLKFVIPILIGSVYYCNALVSKADLPKELQDCYNSYAGVSLRDVVGQSVCWGCEAPVIKRLRTKELPSMETPSSERYVNSLIEKIKDIFGFDSTNTKKCRRKEYRTLTDKERTAFHRAINILKNDTSISPNRYDVLAALHSGDSIRTAHGGPNFLGWHRIYLLILEIALQSVDPNVCLTYWDSSLDNELEDPGSSYVFSPDFLGGRGSNGPVTDGPFAGWVTPRFGPLMRNIGAVGQLYSSTAIDNILSQRLTRDISPPNGRPENGLEFHHNGVHVFIGGQMNNLQAAAHDPAFFLHHTFVDYLWEAFRNRQKRAGIDPQLDYPGDFGSPFHDPNEFMGFNLNVTALQGYSNNVTKSFVYEPSPTCSKQRPTCGSKYLRCNVTRGRCIPIEPDTTTPPPNCPKEPQCTSKYCKKSPLGVQNSYCIDGVCDIRGWVYIPVQIVSVRSPELKKYESYPVHNGSVTHIDDIYLPSAYAETREYIPAREPKSYDKCNDGHGIGQIYVQSNGLSYEGFYKESAIIDQRLSTSLALAYIAVKDPKHGPVKALFRAFDSCGRICHAACRIPGTTRFESCSGVMDISDVPGRRSQYSKTYGQATLNTWGYSTNQNCPSFVNDDIILTFYCDYSEQVPWVKMPVKPTSPPTTTPTTTTTTPTPTPYNECRIDKECTIDVECERVWSHCYRQRYQCRGSCNDFVECRSGKLVKKSCPYNWRFESRTGRCNPLRRCPYIDRGTQYYTGW